MSVSGIKLYNYQGQYQVAQQNPNQTFQTPATLYGGPSFTVNAPASQNSSTFSGLQLGPGDNGQLQASTGSVENINYSNLSAALGTFADSNFNVPASNASLTYNEVIAPYQGYINNQVTDGPANYNQLVAQGNFVIHDGLVGLDVQTNGSQITGVSILPNAGLNFQTGTTNNFSFPDQTDISTRAAAKSANAIAPETSLPDVKSYPASVPIFNTQPAQGAVAKPQTTVVPPAPKGNGANAFDNLNAFLQPPIQIPPATPTSSALQSLLRQQPPDVGLPVAGPNSGIDLQSALSIGASVNGLGLQISQETQANLDYLKQSIAMSANVSQAQQVVNARSQAMPLNPFATNPQAFAQTQSQVTNPSPFLELSTMVDTTDKKTPGGYIPFRMGANANGSGTGSQQGENQQNQEQQRRRMPLSMIA